MFLWVDRSQFIKPSWQAVRRSGWYGRYVWMDHIESQICWIPMDTQLHSNLPNTSYSAPPYYIPVPQWLLNIQECTQERIPALRNQESTYIISHFVKCFIEKALNLSLECLEFPSHKQDNIPPRATRMEHTQVKYLTPLLVLGMNLMYISYIPARDKQSTKARHSLSGWHCGTAG